MLSSSSTLDLKKARQRESPDKNLAATLFRSTLKNILVFFYFFCSPRGRKQVSPLVSVSPANMNIYTHQRRSRAKFRELTMARHESLLQNMINCYMDGNKSANYSKQRRTTKSQRTFQKVQSKELLNPFVHSQKEKIYFFQAEKTRVLDSQRK